MNPYYAAVARRAAHRCEYCRAPEVIFNLPLEVEHVIPLAQGGRDDEDNLALSCRACNLRKSDHLEGFDEITQSRVRLFHPRLHDWTKHFSVETETGAIAGLTATGRATIARLQMNTQVQLAARLQWIRLGVFP